MNKALNNFLITASILAGFACNYELTGKYIRTSKSIQLFEDSTFKFKYGWDMQWDIACGTYGLTNDTITFDYVSDMYDPTCNSDGINTTDTIGVVEIGIDKRFRPLRARLSNKGLYVFEYGGGTEPVNKQAKKYGTYKREK